MSMVKRSISSLIALGVIACAANPISNAGAVDGAQLYKNAVEEASAQSSAAGAFYANTARGALFDIDGNGVDELILLYTIKTEQIPYLVSSVYTLCGGQIETLLDEEPLYPLAGGPNGQSVSLNGMGKTCCMSKASLVRLALMLTAAANGLSIRWPAIRCLRWSLSAMNM